VKHIKQQEDKEAIPLKPSRAYKHLPRNSVERDREKEERRAHRKWEDDND